MRYSNSLLDAPTQTTTTLLFYQSQDPEQMTDPVKAACLKFTTGGYYAVTPYTGTLIGQIVVTMTYDENQNVCKVRSIDAANQAAKNVRIGTPNLVMICYGASGYPQSNPHELNRTVVCLPVGAGKPVELLYPTFTAVGQPLRLKSCAFRLKGY